MNHGQYRIAAKLVEQIHLVFQGFHPGYRDVHANGRYYAGTFTASSARGQKAEPGGTPAWGDPVPVTSAPFKQPFG